MTDLETRIVARVQARERVRALLSLAEGETPVFWQMLREQALARCPLEPQPERRTIDRMTDAQASEFEKVPMPFGKYEGKPVGIVFKEDPDYLAWVLQPDHFKQQLELYLAGWDLTEVEELDDTGDDALDM